MIIDKLNTDSVTFLRPPLPSPVSPRNRPSVCVAGVAYDRRRTIDRACRRRREKFKFNYGFFGSVPSEDGGEFVVNIAGGGFGLKPNGAKPVYFAMLETSLLPHATYSRFTTAPAADPSSLIQSTIKPVGAAGAARVDARAENSASPMLYQDAINAAASSHTGEVYCSVDCYIDHIWGHHEDANKKEVVSLKNCRLWSNETSTWWCPVFIFRDSGDADSKWFGLNGGTYPPEVISAWMRKEHYYSAGTLNTQNGIRNYCQDGLLCYPQNFLFVNRTTAAPNDDYRVYLNEYSSTPTWPTSVLIGYDYWHKLYVDDSFRLAMISTESGALTWNGTALREECICSNWTDTEVDGWLLPGRFTGNLSGKHLWIKTGPYAGFDVGYWQ